MPSPVKQRGRGRPRKDAAQGTGKRPRGRPRKCILPAAEETTSTDVGDAVPTRQEPEDCKLDLSRFEQLLDVDDAYDDCNHAYDEAAVMEKMNDLSALLHEPTVDAFPIRDSAVSVPHFTMPAIDLSSAFYFGNSTLSVRDEPANWDLDRFQKLLDADKDGDHHDEVAVMEKNEFRALISEPTVNVNEALPNRESTVIVLDDREDGYRFEPEPLLVEPAAVVVEPALSPMDSSEKNDDSIVSESITKKKRRGRGRPRKRVSPESLTGNAGNAGNAVIATKRSRTQPCKKAVTVREKPEDSNNWDLARLQQIFAEGYDGEVAVMEKEDGYKFDPEPAMEDLSTLKFSEKNSAGNLVSDSITEKKPRGRPRKRVSPESVTGNAGNVGNAVITMKRTRIPPRKYAETVGEESEDCNKLAPAEITKKRPRGRPFKRKAGTMSEEPEDCNKLDPARLDEVAAMFKVNNRSERPVDVNTNAVGLPHLMSEAQRPSNNDTADGGSTGFAEEVAVMEKHDEVAVIEKVDDHSEPPVNANNAVSSPHLISELQKLSSDMNNDIANGCSTGFSDGYQDEVAVVKNVIDYVEPPVELNYILSLQHFMSEDQEPCCDMNNDIANGDSTGLAEGFHDEVAVVEKELNVSLPHLMSDQRASSDVNNDIADGGSTGFEVEAEGHHDEVVVMEKVSEYSEPPVNNAVNVPHLTSEDELSIIDIFTWDSTWSLPDLTPENQNPPGDLNNDVDISTWDYTVSLPHLMCEDQRPSSDMNNDFANGGSTMDLPDQEAMHMSEDHQRPSSDMNNDFANGGLTEDLPDQEAMHMSEDHQRPSSARNNDFANGGSTVDLPDQEATDNAFPDSDPILNDFANGGLTVDLPDQEAMYMSEDHQRPSSDMNNAFASGGSPVDSPNQETMEMREDQRPTSDMNDDFVNGGSTVDLPDQEAMYMSEDHQRPSSDMNNDFANGGLTEDLPDQEAMHMSEDHQRPSSDINNEFTNGGSTVDLADQEATEMCEDQRPSSDLKYDSGNGGSIVDLPDQEATDNAFPDSDPISNDFGNVGLPDQEAMEDAFSVVSLPEDNQNNLGQAERASRYETPEVFWVEQWGFVNQAMEALNSHGNDVERTNFAPLSLSELPLALALNTCDFPLWLMGNEDMNHTDIEYPDRELSPLWNYER